MFKPVKKKNENNIKKDFFLAKKTTSKVRKDYLIFKSKVNIENTFFVNKLFEIKYFPKKNASFLIITKMNSSPFEMLELAKNPIEIISLFSRINRKNLDFLSRYEVKGVGGQVKSLKKSGLYDEIVEKYDYKFIDNHSKILIFKDGSDYFVLEGSGNPSINSRNEVYILHNNKKLFDRIVKMYENV